MGCVFSTIEDNHIHHINNMMELGGAEISGKHEELKDAEGLYAHMWKAYNQSVSWKVGV